MEVEKTPEEMLGHTSDQQDSSVENNLNVDETDVVLPTKINPASVSFKLIFVYIS